MKKKELPTETMQSPHFNQDSQKNDLDLQACNWNKLETKDELIQATWRGHRAAVYSMLLKKKIMFLESRELHCRLQAICINVSTMIFFYLWDLSF